MAHMRDLRDLDSLLRRLERKPYGAYRQIEGAWEGDGYTLHVDRAQVDPYATPSKLRLRVPQPTHHIPPDLWASPPRKVAVQDFLLRAFAGAAGQGAIRVDAGGAEIIERSGCELTRDHLELRFRVSLPAAGRSILGREAADVLCRRLPSASRAALWQHLDRDAAREWADLCEDHAHLQAQLGERGLVAFVRDGSVLPRASGVSQQPLPGAVPFAGPPSLRVTLPTLHHGEVTGMGVPEGVTVVTGGGFHGKTTLLEALQHGVYPHVPRDGREWVVSRHTAIKVRSEDGRAVAGVDLRPFIRDLPGGKDTGSFSTQDASGSTSLAAAILEAVELGADTLLLDEDSSATNMLIRDARMRALVRRETITPLVDRVRELHSALGVSTLLVVGGSGDYLDVANTVILMEDYLPTDATEQARRVARDHPSAPGTGAPAQPLRAPPRSPLPASVDARRGRRDKVRARGLRELLFGEEVLDLSALEQLVDDSQARAIGAMLKRLGALARPGLPLRDLLDRLYAEVRREGLYALDPSPELALPRPLELAAAINRLRSLVIQPAPPA